MEITSGGITAAKGFLVSNTCAGIKKENHPDMALIYSEKPCAVAGTFTLNKAYAAPVKWDKAIVSTSPSAQAIVVNTGVANACTGEEGLENCRIEAQAVAEGLGIKEKSVLVCSTGVIGAKLPMEKIVNGIGDLTKNLKNTEEEGSAAAKAIMTTDTRPKEIAVKLVIDDSVVTIGGMCKGAGMIHPNMATMLCFITTDVLIKKDVLQTAFSDAIDDSFNMISVDGDTSTNDTALILANGLAENAIIDDIKDPNYEIFAEALKFVATELSKMIAGDGEGCTCLFEANVVNAGTKEDARILAKSIITSNLTKAAIFGHDANWGRILCAMGYSGAEFDPESTDIFFESEAGKIKIVENGKATDYSEEEATKILSCNPVKAIADVKYGRYDATAWGCDLTFDYIKINADYRS